MIGYHQHSGMSKTNQDIWGDDTTSASQGNIAVLFDDERQQAKIEPPLERSRDWDEASQVINPTNTIKSVRPNLNRWLSQREWTGKNFKKINR